MYARRYSNTTHVYVRSDLRTVLLDTCMLEVIQMLYVRSDLRTYSSTWYMYARTLEVIQMLYVRTEDQQLYLIHVC